MCFLFAETFMYRMSKTNDGDQGIFFFYKKGGGKFCVKEYRDVFFKGEFCC